MSSLRSAAAEPSYKPSTTPTITSKGTLKTRIAARSTRASTTRRRSRPPRVEYFGWYNGARPPASLGDVPPAERIGAGRSRSNDARTNDRVTQLTRSPSNRSGSVCRRVLEQGLAGGGGRGSRDPRLLRRRVSPVVVHRDDAVCSTGSGDRRAAQDDAAGSAETSSMPLSTASRAGLQLSAALHGRRRPQSSRERTTALDGRLDTRHRPRSPETTSLGPTTASRPEG
jgi:hypothetical protein